MKKEELLEIKAGASVTLTAALLSAAAKAINTTLELGRTLGTSIRRMKTDNACKF